MGTSLEIRRNRVLIAEDDDSSRNILKAVLFEMGLDVISTVDGLEALEKFYDPNPPEIAILDWLMPSMDGVEACRQIRRLEMANSTYIILLTCKDTKHDVITGLKAGANDYITKPYDKGELKARVGVGLRVVKLQRDLANRIKELKGALDHISTLQGIIPICMHCHKIRDDKDAWKKLEQYISEHTNAQFSHGLCPTCATEYKNYSAYGSK